MIKKFRVDGLNGEKSFELSLYEDVNIITGRNGAGKTTLLKLLWYTMSGNLLNAIKEITFDSITLHTNEYEIKVEKRQKANSISGDNEKFKEIFSMNSALLKSQLLSRNYRRLHDMLIDYETKVTSLIDNKVELDTSATQIGIDEVESIVSSITGRSIFFPTFRRIEGGFTTSRTGRAETYRDEERLERSIAGIAENLSNDNHSFITSISTGDIVDLITREYAHMSEEANKSYIKFSRDIEQSINRHVSNDNKGQLERANIMLQDIKNKMQKNTRLREELFKPFNVLNELIKQIFQYKGIKVTDSVTLGELEETKEAMFSGHLSAGEKQLLSFLCYNAFYKNSSIFIDEPEISLHVDWQRTLMPTLMSQNSNNQFIIATHSPFIYTKYIDREIVLHEDRGGF